MSMENKIGLGIIKKLEENGLELPKPSKFESLFKKESKCKKLRHGSSPN